VSDKITEQEENSNEELHETEENNVNAKMKKSPNRKKNKKRLIGLLIGVFIIAFGVTAILWSNYVRLSQVKEELEEKETKQTKKESEKKEKTEKEEITIQERSLEHGIYGNSLEPFDLVFLQMEDNEKNIVYSPLSIKYALAMLSLGASGDSKAQIDSVIGNYQVRKYTNNEHMSFANALFVRNTFKNNIKSTYQNNLINQYNAEIIFDDFSSPDTINRWVSGKTFQLVNDLVDDVNDSDFYLINALAINMEWKNKMQATDKNIRTGHYSVSFAHEKYSDFIRLIEDDSYGTVRFNNGSSDAKAVEVGATLNNYDIVTDLGEENIRATISKEYAEWLEKGECGSSGNEADVDKYVDQFIKELDSNYQQVITSTDFKLHVDDDYKVFSKELKEYSGTTLEYIGIMPRKTSLNQFIQNMNVTTIQELIGKLKSLELDNFEKGKITKIKGGIPLFNYERKLALMRELQALGIKDVFEASKANLSNMTDTSALIDKVEHKANIEFSNEGIKAAAATSSSGAGSAACRFEHLYDVPVVEVDLTFDKPYLYLIRDKITGEVWFVGAVYEPTVNTSKHAYIINEKKVK